MRFPIDVTNGNEVIGYLGGALEVGSHLSAGAHGNTLYFDGQMHSRIDYGVYTVGCFYDPIQCGQGITLSFWLMLHERTPDLDTIVNNGVYGFNGIGFCFYLFQDNNDYNIGFGARDRTLSHVYSVPRPPAAQWNLFTITFINGDIKMYINGCDSQPYSSGHIVPRPDPYTEDFTFHLGDWPIVGGTSSNVALDELMVWYRVLAVDEIWALYMQGGRV